MTDLVSLGFKADTSDLRRARRDMRGLSDQSSRTGRTVTNSTERMQRGFISLRRVVTGVGAAFAALGIANELRNITRESEQLQRNMLRTGQLIESTGRAASTSADQMLGQARMLARETLDSTEGIMEAQQVLMTFRSIGTESFAEVTERALDLATVTGGSLSGAMNQLGRALEDPVRGINAMERSGVSFSDSQKEMTRDMVEAGNQAGAQRIILDELAQQYGGVARREAEGLAGTQDTLGQSLQEARTEMAETFNVQERATSFYEAVTDAVDLFTFAQQDSREASADLAKDDSIRNWAEDSVELFALVADAARTTSFTLSTAFDTAGKTLGAGAAQAVQLFKGNVQAARGIGQEWLGDMSDINDKILAFDSEQYQNTLKNLDARRAQRDAVAEMDVMLDEAINQQKEMHAAAEQAANATEEQADATESLAEATARSSAESREAVNAAEDLARRYDRLMRRLDPVAAATRDYLDDVETLNDAWAAGLSDGEYDAAIEALTTGVEELTESTREAAEEADPFAEAWKNALRRIDNSFADVWRGAFDSFRDFRRSITSAFKDLLAEMAHAAVTRPIMLSIGAAGGIMPGTAAAGGGAGDLASMAMSVAGGYSGMLSSAAGMATSLGGVLGSGIISGIGSGMGMAAANIGTAGFFGSMGANLGLAASSLGSGAIGTAIGAAIPVIGPAVAALGLAYSLFGGGKPSNKAAFADVDLSSGDVAKDQMTGSKSPAEETVEARDQLAKTVVSVAQAVKAVGGHFEDAALVLDIGERDGVQAVVDGVRTTLKGSGEEIVHQLIDIVRSQSEGLADELMEMDASRFIAGAEAIGALNASLDQISLSALDITAVGLESAASMAEAAGGLGHLLEAQSNYYQTFFSDSEQVAGAYHAIQGAMQENLDTVPRTRQEYRALVESLDLTTEAGRDMHLALMGAAPAFVALQESVSQMIGVTADGVAEMLRDVLANASSEAEARRMAEEQAIAMLYEGLSNTLLASVSNIIMDGIVGALMPNLINGSAAAGSTMAAGGAAGGSAVAEGGAVAGSVLAGVVDQAIDTVNAMAKILADPEFKAAMESIGAAVGNIGGNLYRSEPVRRSFSAPTYRAPTSTRTPSANASSGASIADLIKELRREISDLATESMTSVERARAEIAAGADEWRERLADAGLSGRWGSQLADRLVGEWTDAMTEAVRSEHAKQAASIISDVSGSLEELGMSDHAIRIREIETQAQQYIDALADVGHATAQNIALVDRWTDAMKAEADERRAEENRNRAEESASDAMSALRRQVDAEKELARERLDGIKSTLQEQERASSEQLRGLEQFRSTVERAVDSLRVDSQALDMQRRQQARGQIQAAIASGAVPTDGSLDDALAEVSRPSMHLFGSMQEHLAEAAETAHEVLALQDLTDEAISVEERTLSAIEMQIERADAAHEREVERLDAMVAGRQEQIDAILGLNDGIDSVADAITSVRDAVSALAESYGVSVPAFANGGMHGGGLRLVGERGPELEATGPARYFDANQTRSMMGGGNKELIRELKEIKAMMRQDTDNTDRMQRILQKWDVQGAPESRGEFV